MRIGRGEFTAFITAQVPDKKMVNQPLKPSQKNGEMKKKKLKKKERKINKRKTS